MLRNKKITYLSATLFSTLILSSISAQTVQAATVATSAPSTSESTTSTSTTASTTSTTATSATSTSTAPVSTTSSSVPTSTAPVSTASSSTTTSSTTGAVTTPTGTTSTVAGSTTSSSSVATPTTSTTASTGTTTTSTTSPTTSSTTTSNTSQTPATTGSTSSTSSSGITLPGSSAPVTVPSGPASTTTTSPTTTTKDYSIPSDITDATVVNFADPTLASMVKQALKLKPTDNVTVGDIKAYQPGTVTLNLDEGNYMALSPSTASLPITQYTPITDLDGMQYLHLLPHNMIGFTARLSSAVNVDLTPMDGIDFNGLLLTGNFSDPNAKEIDVNQITKLNVPTTGGIAFNGDGSYNGINESELKTLAPWVVSYSYKAGQFGQIGLSANTINDFSPLKGIDRNDGFNINATGGVYDPTPAYGIKGQPLTFTSTPVLGLDGEDIASGYHFTPTVTDKPVLGNLTNLGNDQYRIESPDDSATTLAYGDTGFDPRYNPTYSRDGLTFKRYGTAVLINITTHSQPLIMQDHPNVTINYVDQNGQPIMANGAALTKTINGSKVGDSFDLTADSNLAGYRLTSAVDSLKGSYTLAPQTVTLAYTALPVSNSSSSGRTITNVTPESENRTLVQVNDIESNPTGDNATLAAMGVKATTEYNGQLFYQIGYGQWVAADSYDFTKSTESGIARIGGPVTLVNAYGIQLDRQLSPNTSWKYDRIVTINGADYYQVATNEFLAVADAVSFTPFENMDTVNTTTAVPVYNSKGEQLSSVLPKGTQWKTDGYATINGIKMYRVATDEWISATDIE